jgi:hypothetical protein
MASAIEPCRAGSGATSPADRSRNHRSARGAERRLENATRREKIPDMEFSFCKRVPIRNVAEAIKFFTSSLLCVITSVFAK